MGVIVFGIGMFLVVLPVTWLLEKLGIMEVPAPSLREVAGSSHRNSAGARGDR